MEITVAGTEASKQIESLAVWKPRRLIAKMPLPKARRGITLRPEEFRDRHGFVRQPCIAVTDAGKRRVEQASESLLVQARQRRCTSGTAHRACRMKIRKLDAVCCESVDVRCLVKPAAVARQVAVTEVVSHDQNDVGPIASTCNSTHQQRQDDGPHQIFLATIRHCRIHSRRRDDEHSSCGSDCLSRKKAQRYLLFFAFFFLGFVTWLRTSLLTPESRVLARPASVASNCSLMSRSDSESSESASCCPSKGPL